MTFFDLVMSITLMLAAGGLLMAYDKRMTSEELIAHHIKQHRLRSIRAIKAAK